eukprot:scaffold7429_cov159-Ochromonas_danica.AAC.1
MGHPGVRRTWLALNEHFPGHAIPYRFVADFVSTCPVCQKDRLGMADSLTLSCDTSSLSIPTRWLVSTR